MKVLRAEPARFADIAFAANHPGSRFELPGWDLAMHVIDEPAQGAERGTFVLLHGQPSWSVLYERWIPRLTAAGYRCVAPDLIGFGRSDTPTDDDWYSYERHCSSICTLIDALDLDRIHLVVQDWGGPIGLRQAVDQPHRFERLFILNTWLHHEYFEYSAAIRWWREAAADPEQLGGDMPISQIVAMTMSREHDLDQMARTYDAPFPDAESKAGARAFPAMLPFARPDVGGAEQQQRCHEALLAWDRCPVHVVFSDSDPIFTWDHGAAWAASLPGATLDRIERAGHFLQADAPDDCLAAIARRLDRRL